MVKRPILVINITHLSIIAFIQFYLRMSSKRYGISFYMYKTVHINSVGSRSLFLMNPIKTWVRENPNKY